MCWVSGRDYDEKLSLLQQQIYGITFYDIKPGEFTKKELWSIFLQFILCSTVTMTGATLQ
jgi:hypothetical protein